MEIYLLLDSRYPFNHFFGGLILVGLALILYIIRPPLSVVLNCYLQEQISFVLAKHIFALSHFPSYAGEWHQPKRFK